jgi:hypothetical protein
MDPDGANAEAIVKQRTPVVGYAWSPNHEMLTFRTLDATPATQQLPTTTTAQIISDAPGSLNTVGVDGGTPITIAATQSDLRYDNPVWNTNGSRLLYRETFPGAIGNPLNVNWWVSQNDQPDGIALKGLPASYSIPSLSYTTSHYQTIENSNQGVFTTSIAGTDLHYITTQPLAGHPLSASMERLLWQPTNATTPAQTFLYAEPIAPSQNNTQAIAGAAPISYQLRLATTHNTSTPLLTCQCNQFAWAPDGTHILYQEGSRYTIFNIQNHTSFFVTAKSNSVPYWSPDSHFLLLDGPTSLILVNVQTQQQQVLLHATQSTAQPNPTLPSTSTLLQPVPNNIWAANSRQFLFLTQDRLNWQNQSSPLQQGLYTVTIDANGHIQNSPLRIDTGNDTQAGWTYEDPNTSFLY